MQKSVLLSLFAIIFILGACSPQPAPSPAVETQDARSTSGPNAELTATSPVSSSTATSLPTSTLTPEPSPTTAATPMPFDPFWGIQIHRYDQPRQVEQAKTAGAVWTRFDGLHWDEIEPVNTNPDSYKWNPVYESALQAAVSAGFQTIVMTLFTPDWAQKIPGVACGPIAENAFSDFAEFMGAAVDRYSQPPYNIRYWELGNEPDVDPSLVNPRSGFGCWGQVGDQYYGGRYYGEMLKTVYPAIKAADPQAQVVIGGLLVFCDPVNPPESPAGSGKLADCSTSRFLEGILEAGGGDYFDAVSFHAYDYYYGVMGAYGNGNWHSSSTTTGPVLIAKTRYLRSVLASYGYPDKALFNTEMAILCGSNGKDPECVVPDFDTTKAYYLAQSNAAAAAESLDGNIWYSMTGWRGSGLLDSDLNKKPALDAFAFSAEQLKDATYLGEVSGYEGVKGYQFQRQDGQFWLIWSLDGEDHPINLPAPPVAVYDVFGNPADDAAGSQDLTITLSPVYILFSP